MAPFPNGSYQEGTTAEFSCDETFMLHGLEILTCQTSGYWNGMLQYVIKLVKK